MPIQDPKAGSAFIWIISCILFICVSAGGGLLLYYILNPESESAHWSPIVGVALVSLPWFFWFLTFVYRVFSRSLGVRLGDGGNNKTGENGVNKIVENVAHSSKSLNRINSQDVSKGSFGRHVQVVEAMLVVNEKDVDAHGEEMLDDVNVHGRSISIVSHESEIPLASSLASSA